MEGCSGTGWACAMDPFTSSALVSAAVCFTVSIAIDLQGDRTAELAHLVNGVHLIQLQCVQILHERIGGKSAGRQVNSPAWDADLERPALQT